MWPTIQRTEVDWWDAAVSAVRNYCGWHVAPVFTETVHLDGSGQRAILLPTKRLVELVEVKENGSVVNPSAIEWSPAGVVRKRSGAWTDRLGGIEVTMRHGHEQADDFLGLIETISARAASAGKGALREVAGPFQVQRATHQGAVVSLPLMESEKAALDRYRLAGWC